MEIRRMIADDVPRVAQMEREIFSDPWAEKDIFSYVTMTTGICYSAVRDGEVIAYVIGRMIAPEGEVYRIATDERYRRRGIAYRLLDYAMKCEKGRGLECLFLEVRSKNVAARNLYRAHGFKEVGERKNYYSNPTDDAVIMLRAHSDDMKN